jgi:hypothetical protein
MRTSGPGTDRAKQVNSKKLECSEYGTPAMSLEPSSRSDHVPTIHHELPAASSHRFETGMAEGPRLVSPDDHVDIWQHVCSSGWRVRPSSRSETKDAIKVWVETCEIGLQTIQLYVA